MTEKLYDDLMERSKAEPYSRLLGMEVVDVGPGSAVVRMRVNPEMANIFGSTHGGALFSLIDEAFQLACNTHGVLSVALNVSITYIAAAAAGSVLEARATEVHKTRRTSSYLCEIRERDDRKLIATAQALAYRTGKDITSP
ncbi:MAG: hotdog fold thioesterase [Desulfomonile tiedjei]|uniref:Hotdog fold thioesterase n=1 Tax=Desulfomonile tiedjei TaxID=2358 RepID=A0A9D6Z2N6_9BACT|nr:hotdog fold thioesterase [Desulfomonile tiedjei]